ncbi:MAG: hypothetical protein J4G05_11940 [Chlorobi bacterium]|nr:hypothetical protein [Chlorobiota bacterium]
MAAMLSNLPFGGDHVVGCVDAISDDHLVAFLPLLRGVAGVSWTGGRFRTG